MNYEPATWSQHTATFTQVCLHLAVVEVNETVRPELAVALNAGGVAVSAILLMVPNVIVWVDWILNVWVTAVAAA